MIRRTKLPNRPGLSSKGDLWRYQVALVYGATIVCVALAVMDILLSPQVSRQARSSETTSVIGDCQRSAAACPVLTAKAPAAGERTKTPLFFGYVEFDWDPDEPGGVPGFGPLQPSNLGVYAETTK